MKNNIVLFIILLFGFNAQAQVNGNKNIKTKTFDFKNIKAININFPTITTIDASQSTNLALTADENLFKYIGVQVKNGTLYISQDAWIKPSKDVTVKIGIAGIQKITTSGYGNHAVKNLNQSTFSVNSGVSTINLEGQVNTLNVKATTGKVNAKNLIVKEATVNVTSHGTIHISPTELLVTNLDENGKVIYDEKPRQIQKNNAEDAIVIAAITDKKEATDEVKYIKLKVKNNSKSFINTYVRGPRNRRFSYGLPFKKNQTRDENFPIGTKIFLVSKMGMRRLLVTVTAENENQVLELF